MDRGKVIKGLECHQIDKDHRINCSDCPYHCDEFMNGLNELHNDALALLKEQQEQIEILRYVLKEQEAEWLEVDDKHDAFDCSNCGAMAGRKCLYCPGCGAKMKNGTRAMEGR